MIRIEYGVPNAYTDVTRKALIYHYITNKCSPFILRLPATEEERVALFQDPLEGVLKEMRIHYRDHILRYPAGVLIQLDIRESISEINERIDTILASMDADAKLFTIHRYIKFFHGSMTDELIEQYMACMFISPEDVVLEIGSNIGRNSLVIASLLKDPSNLVTLETDSSSCEKLQYNSMINQLLFHIENAALFRESSTRMLLQKNESWDTLVSEKELPEYNKVKTITWENLKIKYNKTFTTLVADCEGSLYYILHDFPDLLDTFHTVIMENDYHEEAHKFEVDRILIAKGFACNYRKVGGWGPCKDRFFETWRRIS